MSNNYKKTYSYQFTEKLENPKQKLERIKLELKEIYEDLRSFKNTNDPIIKKAQDEFDVLDCTVKDIKLPTTGNKLNSFNTEIAGLKKDISGYNPKSVVTTKKPNKT